MTGSGTGYVDSATGMPLSEQQFAGMAPNPYAIGDPFSVPYNAIDIPPSTYNVPPIIVPTSYYGGG